MPEEAALPPMHARAATLASGILPSRQRHDNLNWLKHWNISVAVAEGIAGSLGQVLLDEGR